eukprot:4871270-Pleurochrysis_carterae.AAC.2
MFRHTYWDAVGFACSWILLILLVVPARPGSDMSMASFIIHERSKAACARVVAAKWQVAGRFWDD